MRVLKRSAILLLLSTSMAFAQAAAPEPAPAGTPEGARGVVDGLVPYFGRTGFDRGIVKVDPDPAGYRITFDPAPLLADLPKDGTVLEVLPYSFVVSRRDDGNWNYFTNAPLRVKADFTLEGNRQSVEYSIPGSLFKGVYSTAIAAPLTGSGSFDGISMAMNDPQSNVVASTGRNEYSIASTPVADGSAADMTMTQRMVNFVETIQMKEAPGLPPGGFNLSIKAAEATSDMALAAGRMRQLVDLYSFFVTHPEYFAQPADRAALALSQEDLKDRLRAALPLWNDLTSRSLMSGIDVSFPYGNVRMASLNADAAMNGVSRSGSISYAFGFKGLEVSSPFVPAWAQSLIPQDMDLRMKLDNLDLAGPVDAMLADLDVTRPEPISAGTMERVGTMFATNPPRFTMEPSRIRSRDLDVSMSGSFVVADNKPAATVDIKAAGVDKAIATLQEAAKSDPSIHQAVGGISMAKGFGKTLPDGRTQWLIDVASDGSVKVNGFQVKGPDPVAAPLPDDGLDLGDDAEGLAPDGDVPLDEAPTDDNALPDAPPQP